MMDSNSSRVPLFLLTALAALGSLSAAAAVLVSRQPIRMLLGDPERRTEWALLSLLMLGAFVMGAFVTFVFFV